MPVINEGFRKMSIIILLRERNIGHKSVKYMSCSYTEPGDHRGERSVVEQDGRSVRSTGRTAGQRLDLRGRVQRDADDHLPQGLGGNSAGR